MWVNKHYIQQNKLKAKELTQPEIAKGETLIRNRTDYGQTWNKETLVNHNITKTFNFEETKIELKQVYM